MKILQQFKGKYFRILIIFILGAILASYTFCNKESKQQVLLRLIMQTLNIYHYSPQNINDEFSNKVYALYFKNLDHNKCFFTKEDLKKFEKYKNEIDDEIQDGNIEFYTLVSQTYAANVDKIQKYYNEILSKPMDFNINEKLETNSDKYDFPENDAALKEEWRKLLKYQVLTRVASDMKIQENSKNLPDSAKKTFAQIEESARNSVLKLHNTWFRRIKQAKEIDNYSIFLNSIAGVYDPHTEYWSPQDKETFDIGISGQLEGIGALLQEWESRVKVSSIVPGSPSWLQGELKAGDIILKVKQENQEPVDIYDMPINDVVKLVRGKKGTKVTLTVQKVDKSIKDITITRDVVIIEESYAKSSLIEDPKYGNIGYIYLPSFYTNIERTDSGRYSSIDMKKEIEKLQNHNLKGMIIDLRNNGGGSLPEAIKIAGLFITQGPIVQVKTNSGEPRVHFDNDPSIAYKGPLVILVNSFSASASEIFAAAMQDYKRAIIMGSNSTFGKGTVQNVLELDEIVPSSYSIYQPLGAFKVTIQKYYRINGGATQLKGVIPDIIMPDIYSDIKTGEREEDYYLPWTQIKPASYTVWNSPKPYNNIIKTEQNFINSSGDFKIFKEEASQIKKQRDESLVNLNYNQYRKEEDSFKNQNKSYDELLKKDYGLKILALPEDLTRMQKDTSSVSRLNNWVKDLKKDIYLNEAVKVVDQLVEP